MIRFLSLNILSDSELSEIRADEYCKGGRAGVDMAMNAVESAIAKGSTDFGKLRLDVTNTPMERLRDELCPTT